MTGIQRARAWLASVCSADTMARIVDPTLADARFEDGALTWRGCGALLRALAIHAVMSAPHRSVSIFAEDAHAIPRLTVLSAVAALVIAVPLVMPPLWNDRVHHAPLLRGWLFITLLPQALGLALPSALLVAVPMAVRRAAPSRRLVGRVLVIAGFYAGLTFIVIDRMVPAANQSFRAAVLGLSTSELQRGPAETPSRQLKQQIDRLRGFQGSTTVIRRLEFDYEVRRSLSWAPLPIAALALACAFTPFGRRRPFLTGVTALAVYGVALFGFAAYVAEPALRASSLPAQSLAWVPNAALILSAGFLTARLVRDARHPESLNACSS